MKEQKRYINQVSEELAKNIFTLKDVKKEWKGRKTEDLFTQRDRIKVIKTLFPDESKYSKSKFNTAIQDIFINKKKITFSKQTKANFEFVFEFIKSNL